MKRLFKAMRQELRAMKSGHWYSMTGGIDWTSPLWEPNELRDLVHLVLRTI